MLFYNIQTKQNHECGNKNPLERYLQKNKYMFHSYDDEYPIKKYYYNHDKIGSIYIGYCDGRTACNIQNITIDIFFVINDKIFRIKYYLYDDENECTSFYCIINSDSGCNIIDINEKTKHTANTYRLTESEIITEFENKIYYINQIRDLSSDLSKYYKEYFEIEKLINSKVCVHDLIKDLNTITII